MFIEQQDIASGYLQGSAPAPTPLSKQEWGLVEQSDNPSLQAIATQELGAIGSQFTLDPEPYDVLLNVFVSEIPQGATVSLELRIKNRTVQMYKTAYSSEPPPTAVRIGVEKFWYVFGQQIAMIAGDSPATQSDSGDRTLSHQSPIVSSTGSGFIASKEGHILTNEHVVADCSAVVVRQAGREPELVEIVVKDKPNDLALLKLTEPPARIAVFGQAAKIRPGDPIIVIGFPLQGLLTSSASVSTGIVNAMAGPYDDTSLLQISAPVQSGHSGGGIFNENGHVVGMVIGVLDQIGVAQLTGNIPQNVNFGIKSIVLKTFLDTHRVRYEICKSAKKLTSSDVGEIAIPATVLVACIQ